MSRAIVDEIWDYSKAKGSPKLVLLALGRHAHDDGTHAFPSLRTLATMTNLTVPHVWEILQDLAAGGHLLIAPRHGPQGQNLYTILRPWDLQKIGTHQKIGYRKDRNQKIGTEVKTRRKKEKTLLSVSPAVYQTSENHLIGCSEKPSPDDPGYLAGLNLVKASVGEGSHIYLSSLPVPPPSPPPPTDAPDHTTDPPGTYRGAPCKRNTTHVLPTGQSRRINVKGRGSCWECHRATLANSAKRTIT